VFLFLYAGNAYPFHLESRCEEKSGPIPIVNQTPIQLLFLQPIPDKAETLPKGQGSLRLNIAITNTLLSGSSTNYEGVVDMEMIRASLDVQYGIVPGLEMGVCLPFVYRYSGIMDHAILEFEEAFNAEGSIRKDQVENEYEYCVKRNDTAFISGNGEKSSGIGDLALWIKGKVWDEGDILPCLSTRLGVKIPTGDEDRALGSGKADYGFGLLLQKDMRGLTAYLNADVIFPGDAFVNCIARPFKQTGLQMLDRRIYDSLVGINYLTEGGISVQGGAIEDFKNSGNAGADITFFLTVGKGF